MRKTGHDLIVAAEKYLGRPYVLGAVVPKNNLPYAGAFDCAELCARAIVEVTGELYGCRGIGEKADAYTGYFGNDAEKIGVKITVEDAERIEGAMLIRLPTGSATGHIVFVKPGGKTIEARGSKYGVVNYKTGGRNWDYGILLPFVDYSRGEPLPAQKPLGKLIKLVTPFLIDVAVGLIQKVLKDHGLYHGEVDNVFGSMTQAGVVKFQQMNGLTPDGQLLSGGETAKAMGIKF